MSQSFDAQPARDPRLQQVLDRASTDVQFRQWLLASPHAAIRDTFGVNIPSGFRLKFVERGADTDALIVLPGVARQVNRADGELDDAALEQVAGGWSWGEGKGESANWSENPAAGWGDTPPAQW